MVGLRAFSQPSSRVSISFSNCWRSGPRRHYAGIGRICIGDLAP